MFFLIHFSGSKHFACTQFRFCSQSSLGLITCMCFNGWQMTFIPVFLWKNRNYQDSAIYRAHIKLSLLFLNFKNSQKTHDSARLYVFSSLACGIFTFLMIFVPFWSKSLSDILPFFTGFSYCSLTIQGCQQRFDIWIFKEINSICGFYHCVKQI